MPKDKISIGGRVLHCLTYHPWLKLISLFLASIVWLYVRGEISRIYF